MPRKKKPAEPKSDAVPGVSPALSVSDNTPSDTTCDATCEIPLSKYLEGRLDLSGLDAWRALAGESLDFVTLAGSTRICGYEMRTIEAGAFGTAIEMLPSGVLRVTREAETTYVSPSGWQTAEAKLHAGASAVNAQAPAAPAPKHYDTDGELREIQPAMDAVQMYRQRKRSM